MGVGHVPYTAMGDYRMKENYNNVKPVIFLGSIIFHNILNQQNTHFDGRVDVKNFFAVAIQTCCISHSIHLKQTALQVQILAIINHINKPTES